MLYIEATLLPDGRGMRLTGQLGDVMRESAKAAQSYVWSHADATRHRPERCSASPACTSTSRPARCPRTARRPAWRW